MNLNFWKRCDQIEARLTTLLASFTTLQESLEDRIEKLEARVKELEESQEQLFTQQNKSKPEADLKPVTPGFTPFSKRKRNWELAHQKPAEATK